MVPLYVGIVAAYILGSIPTALIAGRLIAGIDIRTTGSRNAGATNLYRVAGLKLYIAVLGFDILKGFAATKWISQNLFSDTFSAEQIMILCGFSAVAGHIFTLFARFKGGKGVASAAGVMLALIPVPLLLAIALYVLITSITHYVSLGSIGAAVSLPLICLISYYSFGIVYSLEIYLVVTLLAVVIIITHRSNIRRLLRGEENKTYFFKKSKQ